MVGVSGRGEVVGVSGTDVDVGGADMAMAGGVGTVVTAGPVVGVGAVPLMVSAKRLRLSTWVFAVDARKSTSVAMCHTSVQTFLDTTVLMFGPLARRPERVITTRI